MIRRCLPCIAVPMLLVLPVGDLAAQKTFDVHLSTGRPPGWSLAAQPAIAADGDRVTVVWSDDRAAGAGIYANRSLDHGATWMATDVRISGAGTFLLPQFCEPLLSQAGDLVVAAWPRFNGTDFEVWVGRSADGGATWSSPVRVQGSALAQEEWPWSVLVTGPQVVLLWTELVGWYKQLRFARSLDGGITWSPAARLDSGLTSTIDRATLAADGNTLLAVWLDHRVPTHRRLFANRSLDGGATWLATDVLVSRNPPNGDIMAHAAAVAGTRCCVAFADSRNYTSGDPTDDLWLNGSTDSGASWWPADRQVNAVGASAVTGEAPALVLDGTRIALAWAEHMAPTSQTAGDILFRTSPDFGLTWQAPPVRLDTGSPVGSSDSMLPRLFAQGASLTAIWSDWRSGTYGVYTNRSADWGATWLLPTNVRIDRVGTVSPTSPAHLAAALGGAGVHAAWADPRAGFPGFSDIYYNLAHGAQPYGQALAGAGGFVPRLVATGVVGIGGTFALELAQGLGGAVALVALGAGPATIVAVPVFGGVLAVAPDVALAVVLGGASGVAGAGGASLPVPVPQVPALLGFDLNAQVLVLDGGAIGGFAFSNALQCWIG